VAWTEEVRDKNGNPTGKIRGCYRDSRGKIVRKTFTHKKPAANWSALQEEKAQDAQNVNPARGRMLWSAWCEQWWPTRKMSDGYRSSQQALRVGYVEPRWGDVPLNKIEQADIQAWINHLNDETKLSASSVRQAYVLLSASLKAAVVAKVLASSPCFAVKQEALPPAPERYLTAKEIAAVMAALGCEEHRLLVLIMLETGMRIGEAVALHWQRVDMFERTIVIAEKWNLRSRTIEATPKGDRAVTVPISDELYAAFEARRKSQQAWKVRKCGLPHQKGSVCRSDLVVRGPKGAIIDQHNFTGKVLKRALKKAQVDDARSHDLRHTFASRLARRNVSLARVQKLLGHKSITTTQRYSHLQDEGHDEIRNILAETRKVEEKKKDREREEGAA
jgi:integrase